MSRPSATDTNKQLSGDFRTSSDVLGIPAISSSEIRDDQGDNKYNRMLRLSTNKSKKDLATWALLGGGENTSYMLDIAASGEGKSTIENLGNAARMMGLGASLVPSLIGLGLQAVFAGADIGSDLKRALSKGEKVIAEETTEAAAKSSGKVLAQETTGAGTKVLTEEATETGAKVLAREATEAAATPVAKSLTEGLVDGLFGGLKFLGKGLKAVPVVGMVVTAGFVAYEVAGFISSGETDKAYAAAVVGAAETGGAFFGGIASNAARELTRTAVVKFGGEEFEDIARSDVMALVDAGTNVYNQFQTAAAAPATPYSAQQYAFNPNMALTHG